MKNAIPFETHATSAVEVMIRKERMRQNNRIEDEEKRIDKSPTNFSPSVDRPAKALK